MPLDPPDTHSQLEDLLGAVWDAEADWRFNDRLDVAVRQREVTPEVLAERRRRKRWSASS